ncbi:MAG: serine/threonine-protein kinase [Acidobacteria bacterium]|nr:serine/threonine-protein kinase [Acidobacteriota bacterium]
MIGKTISHYRILGQAGEGGMGVVYVAEDLHLGRRVAIKIPHAGRDESHYRARFLREARSVSKLRHPNIAAVHDYGETDEGQPFIVMELVSGQTLGDVLAGSGLSIARSVEVACQTAEALSEAHRRGVVHRDIKPSNVVIDDQGEVKVLDFGLAKQLHEEGAGGPDAATLLSARTRSDVVIGTPLYLSPEQARGSKVDGRSDLFALGALLYECLTGRPAFSGSNVIEIGAQVLHFDPPPPSRFNPRVPAELDRLTLKALAKKPEDRFQSAAELASELARVRSRLPDSDTSTTRRLAGVEVGHRSSALTTMAEALRRPKFSPLTLVASLAALALVVFGVAYARRPSPHRPAPGAAALYQEGAGAMREGSYYRASVLLSQAVEKDGEFALARARLAEAMLEMDFLDRAKDEMIAVGELVPDFSIYPRADALYFEAVRSTVRQNYGDAINAYQKIVELSPASPEAHLNLGRAYERDNQVEKAAQKYTEATGLDPAYARAFVHLGALHARRGNQPGAAAAFDTAQKLYAAAKNKEGEAAVRYQRGRLFFNVQQKLAEAGAEFGQALALARETKNTYQQVQALLQLALTLGDPAEAQKTAQEGLDLAQASGMNDQVANAYITQGNVLFGKLSKYDEADAAYGRAIQYASNYKLRRYEALTYTNMASLRDRQGRFDEAVAAAEKAREFYILGGYRNEVDRSAMLIARIRRRKGDYEGALKVFEELLRSAEQSGDEMQAATLHRECGAALSAMERYAEALTHYKESVSGARALRHKTLLAFSLLNQANAFWSVGRYEEAADNFRQLVEADPQQLSVSNDLLVNVHLAEAEMELSRHRFAEASAAAGRALALLKESKNPPNDSLSLANANLGQAEARHPGKAARTRALCEEAARLAGLGADASVAARAQYALAFALSEAGDAAGARAAALQAHESYARLGRAESAWRALALAGKAGRRAGDEDAAREHLARAATSLEQFQQSLGAEAAGYLSRPDVQWLRGELGASPAGATR